ncbi:MAG: DNA repair protein RecN, partial [Nannocystaceae bacterium]
MLTYLRIRGLALIDDVSLEFGQGMTVLTGETGAGKSIIVDALGLLRGARGRSGLVRNGETKARVEAQFELTTHTRARAHNLLCELGLNADGPDGPDGPDGLLLARVVNRGGRGRCFVQSGLSTVGILEQFGEHLIDICSQHEYHSLTHVGRHIELLDAYASIDAEVSTYRGAFLQWQQACQDLETLRASAAQGAARADYLRFQLEELERIQPEPGEYADLRARISLMRNSHKWLAFARTAHDVLYESDDAITGRLSSLLDEASRGRDESQVLSELSEQLIAAQVACEEAAAAAVKFASEIEVDPGEFEQAEERLHDLEGLRRKHGVEPDTLADRIEEMREELDTLDHADEHLAALEARETELRGHCESLAGELRKARQQACTKLSHAIETELAALHMPHARIEVAQGPRQELGPRGLDTVEFLFSANTGEPVAPLTKVASGGELSRVLLAIKGVLATGDHVTTYVFDEVDSGVGGAVAESIGRRLSRASTGRQV